MSSFLFCFEGLFELPSVCLWFKNAIGKRCKGASPKSRICKMLFHGVAGTVKPDGEVETEPEAESRVQMEPCPFLLDEFLSDESDGEGDSDASPKKLTAEQLQIWKGKMGEALAKALTALEDYMVKNDLKKEEMPVHGMVKDMKSKLPNDETPDRGEYYNLLTAARMFLDNDET